MTCSVYNGRHNKFSGSLKNYKTKNYIKIGFIEIVYVLLKNNNLNA